MKNPNLLAGVIGGVLFAVVACGKPATEANGDKEKACEMAKDLVRLCYDNSSPEVACSQLTGQVRTGFSKYTSDDEMLDGLAKLCGTACDARKDGRTWSDLNQRVDCDQIARR
jgi:hypothetical protein